jgi:cytochrome bd-type quinol oxidase subunit 2
MRTLGRSAILCIVLTSLVFDAEARGVVYGRRSDSASNVVWALGLIGLLVVVLKAGDRRQKRDQNLTKLTLGLALAAFVLSFFVLVAFLYVFYYFDPQFAVVPMWLRAALAVAGTYAVIWLFVERYQP